MSQQIQAIVAEYNSDKTRLMDILWQVQHQLGSISDASVEALAKQLNMSPLDVRETASFYHFFHAEPFGKHAIYLCDSAIGRMNGHGEVRAALERETGATFGSDGATELFGLDDTPCIGLSDQEPAMLVDDVAFTRLTPSKVADIVAGLKSGKTAAEIVSAGEHETASQAYVDALVDANIRKEGEIFFKPDIDYKAVLQSCLDQTPEEVIVSVLESKIRGRGGAGFPTGLKWRLANDADGDEKYIICNADEGEPGTFKDRVLLTRSARDVLVGMIIGGYAIGSTTGILYLRAEYWYLKAYLEAEIAALEAENLLGSGILGSDFTFSIRIQMGAGSYVCGDETALIESCEGKRGTPRVKPPFPIQNGYMGQPTVVNNVETFASVTRIMEMGSGWFAGLGTDESSGSRLLSVSGDCDKPGIYEVPWGISLNDVLAMVGARNPKAVQISGPSGELVSVEKDGHRKLCYSDLACNGSFMIFDESRDLLDIVRQFMHFFVDESCGICTPCRTGGVAMLGKIDRVIAGRAQQKDLDECNSWGQLMRSTSRCGLGTTAAKPILTSLKKFPELYEARLNDGSHTLLPSFDLEEAVSLYDDFARTVQEEAKL